MFVCAEVVVCMSVIDVLTSAVQEGQLSYEEAILAKQNHISETRGKVSLMKEEVTITQYYLSVADLSLSLSLSLSHFSPLSSQAEKLMTQYFAKREEERREMRQLVETIMKGHRSASEAKSKLQKMKQKIGKYKQMEHTCEYTYTWSVVLHDTYLHVG